MSVNQVSSIYTNNSQVNFGQLRIRKNTFKPWVQTIIQEDAEQHLGNQIRVLEGLGYDIFVSNAPAGQRFYLSRKGTSEIAHDIGRYKSVDATYYPNGRVSEQLDDFTRRAVGKACETGI